MSTEDVLGCQRSATASAGLRVRHAYGNLLLEQSTLAKSNTTSTSGKTSYKGKRKVDLLKNKKSHFDVKQYKIGHLFRQ